MTQSATPPPPGVYTPSPTFLQNPSKPGAVSKLDIEEQTKHTIFLADNGINGVVLLGSTGEMIHLTRDEHSSLIKGVRAGLDAAGYKEFPIIAGVAQHGVENALADIRAAAEAGATYVLVLAPNYFGPSSTQTGIIDWYTNVADDSPIPVIIYYYPGVSNNLLITPDTFVTLSAHPNIVGTKMSHGNVSYYAQIALNPQVQKNNFETWTGLGQVLLPATTVGITGTIDAISGAFPKTLVKLLKLSTEGKIKEAAKIQYTVSKVEELVADFGPRGMKFVINYVTGLGKDLGGRPPLNVALTTSEVEPYLSAINEAWELEKSL